MEPVKIEISKPRRFGVFSILAKYAFSFLLAIPLLAAFLILSTVRNLGQFWILAVPLLALAATVYFLPSLGNAYVYWVLGPVRAQTSDNSRQTPIVQITLCPRIRTGFRALIEDADDVGYLTFTESELNFRGDSLQVIVPFERLGAVHGENVGLRGAYLSGGRIRLDISGRDDFEALEIAERTSLVLPASRRITRELFERIKALATRGSKPQVSS